MEKRSLIFMGTPEFAVHSLCALHEAGFNIKAVVTQPDKQRGRGKKISFTPVKTAALELGLPVLQPVKMKDPEFLSELEKYGADLFVVVAFRILPSIVLSIPALGSVNLHASILPYYRGAAPINHAIFNGEKTTGVTVFFLNKSIDTGNIILSKTVKIDEDDNYGTLYDKLAVVGSKLLSGTVKNIYDGNYHTKQQDYGEFPLAPKILSEDLVIDWNLSAEHIRNRIRGLSPKPGAYSMLNGKRIRIILADSENREHGEIPGTVTGTDRKAGTITVACGKGFLVLKTIQPESKPVTSVKNYLNGNRIETGAVFT